MHKCIIQHGMGYYGTAQPDVKRDGLAHHATSKIMSESVKVVIEGVHPSFECDIKQGVIPYFVLIIGSLISVLSCQS